MEKGVFQPKRSIFVAFCIFLLCFSSSSLYSLTWRDLPVTHFVSKFFFSCLFFFLIFFVFSWVRRGGREGVGRSRSYKLGVSKGTGGRRSIKTHACACMRECRIRR